MKYPREEALLNNQRVVDRCIDISGTPSEVWPWLAQMGSGRAGWYSYDWLDNLGKKSFHFIDPELIQISQNQKVSFAVISELELNKLLTYQFGDWASMTYLLEPRAKKGTRLWSRARFYHSAWLLDRAFELGHLFMQHKQFVEIKKRVENREAISFPSGRSRNSEP